jgi:hypothetical protein
MRHDLPGQLDMPGTAVEVKGQIRRRGAAPLRSGQAQMPCDIGLFSDDADQTDLIEMLLDPVDDQASGPEVGASGPITAELDHAREDTGSKHDDNEAIPGRAQKARP